VSASAPVEVANRVGAARPPGSGDVAQRRDPADDRVVVSVVHESTDDDVRAAVDAAAEAAPAWGGRPAGDRAAFLERAADALAARVDEVAELLTREEGKPLTDARNETGRAVRNLRLYAGEALRLRGATFPADEAGVRVWSTADPLGVVAAISPWNFPLSLSSRKIGPALAAGNTVVWKPSPFVPAVSDALARAFEEAELPAGVLNVVHGSAAGALLVADARVAGVTFTGSTRTGARIHAALGPGRRAQLELGGNNPVVVLADADLERAADVVARSSFSLTGQACTGAGRILVEDAVHDDLVARVVARAEAYTIGPGLASGTTMGPLVDARALAAMEEVVADAEAHGAKTVCGGRRLAGGDLAHGWFFPATLLVDVEATMRTSCEEVFGPVVGVERVAGIDDAIARANDTEYGLAAAICTTSMASAERFVNEVRAGIVKVNRSTIGAGFAAPFGGIKASGTSKEQLGPGVMDFYTVSRTVELAP
jgi:acyl-CoA reductase-like NAD-dependent aldehyde dehydrogenase